MRIKKILALMLSIMVTLTSMATLNADYAVNAASSTYKSLLTPDTTALTADDFTLDADRNKDDTTFTVSSSADGTLIQVTAPETANCGNAYYILDESFTPDYNSTTVIRFNAVETNKYVQYKPFLVDSTGTRHHVTGYVTDGSTMSADGGDEIVLTVDWSASTSQVYRNGEAVQTLKTFPTQAALNGGMKIGFALSSDKATATRSFTVSDLSVWETSADALSCTVESAAEGTAQVKFNMPLFEEPTISINGNAVTATKVNAATYSIDTAGLAVGNHTVSVSAESITSLAADYTYVVKAASVYKGLLFPDTTALTASDFAISADKNEDTGTFNVSSDAAGVTLEVTAPPNDSCGNAYYVLNDSFTPNHNSKTVIHFNAVEATKYVQYKPFLQDSADKKYHTSAFLTDETISSVDGGDDIVLEINWAESTSQMYRNGEAVGSLKTFPGEGEIQLGFVLSSKKAASRSLTISDLEIWEVSGETSLSYTVESTTPGIATLKFNIPLFKAPTVTIDGVAVTATKVDALTYTVDTSDLEAGTYNVSVSAKSIASLEAQETTITISGFDANDKSLAKLSYSNGKLHLTKRPGATISAWIIKTEYQEDGTFNGSTTLAKGVTGSTSIPSTNTGGMITRYYAWSDDGKLTPLGEPLEIRVPKYTEAYDEPIYTLSKNTDVISTDIETTANDVYYARVYAYGEDSNHRLTISVKEGDTVTQTFSYFVSTQLAAVYLPFTATGNETSVEVTLEDGGKFHVSEPEIEKSTETYHKTKTGTYLIASEDWTYGVVTVNETDGLLDNPTDGDERGMTNNRSMDCVVVDDYMYALRNNRLHVLKKDEGGNFKPVYMTEFYGELREMDLTEDKKGLVVVGRNYGVFAFDITNPEKPVLASHIDSLEMSSGLDIHGDYLYVADRNSGITIFNIADLYDPHFVSNIATGETQNVCYYNGYVYAGVWAESVVRVCDVRDVNKPVILKSIPISGRGDGVLVKDGILYAVTGQHARIYPTANLADAYSHQTTDKPGYGVGIGLELWNIENPETPERLSVVRFDGAEYIGSPDVWRVESYGDKYICATNVYAGAYIYDVEDTNNPVRVAQYQALGTATPNSLWNNEDIYVHQRDPETGNHTSLPLSSNRRAYPVIGIAIDDDKLYMGTCEYGVQNNLYEVQLPINAGDRDANTSTIDIEEKGTPYYMLDYQAKYGENAKYFNSGTQIRAAAVKGDYLYLAAGTDGIIILNKNTMEKVGSVASRDITKDVQIFENYLYTAEATAGVAIYEINTEDPTKLTLVGNQAFAQAVVQIQLSPYADFALAHYANTGTVLDLRDKTAPKLYESENAKIESFSVVYQNQMSIGCIDNRYLMMSSSRKDVLVCDFGEDGRQEPIVKQWVDGISISGLCADSDGKHVILSSGRNIYRFNPGDLDLTDLSKQIIKNQITPMANYGSIMGQCPVVLGDYMFVMHRHKGNSRILKLSEDRTSATAVKINDALPANPNMAIYDAEADRYYLPLGFAGIVSIDMADLEL
ncbi:MAG: hypothetical protein IJE10_07185 [Clostridia bacterium]|nr:hypothetical protein [Clostridia bacterium]